LGGAAEGVVGEELGGENFGGGVDQNNALEVWELGEDFGA